MVESVESVESEQIVQGEDTQQLQTDACSPPLLSSQASETKTSQVDMVKSELAAQSSEFAGPEITAAGSLLVQNDICQWPPTLIDHMRRYLVQRAARSRQHKEGDFKESE